MIHGIPWNGEMKLQDARAPPTPKDEPSSQSKRQRLQGGRGVLWKCKVVCMSKKVLWALYFLWVVGGA